MKKEMDSSPKSEIILYQPNETVSLEVRLDEETVWLSQQQIAELFGVNQPAISKHIANIYKSGELEEHSTYSILEYMGNDGKQLYSIKAYNLDMILSVGYRINSANATRFRQWANKVLKEYLLRGYSVNQQLSHLEQRIDNKLQEHTEQIHELQNKVEFFIRTSLPPSEGIFYDGQIFDAYLFANDRIREAKERIILIDNYIDDSVLSMLDKRGEGVSATIYTKNLTRQLALDFERHNSQYAPIDIIQFDKSHDRFLCIDETVYHLGASLKDLGKKWFAFCRMELTTTELVNKMQ